MNSIMSALCYAVPTMFAVDGYNHPTSGSFDTFSPVFNKEIITGQ